MHIEEIYLMLWLEKGTVSTQEGCPGRAVSEQHSAQVAVARTDELI